MNNNNNDKNNKNNMNSISLDINEKVSPVRRESSPGILAKRKDSVVNDSIVIQGSRRYSSGIFHHPHHRRRLHLHLHYYYYNYHLN